MPDPLTPDLRARAEIAAEFILKNAARMPVIDEDTVRAAGVVILAFAEAEVARVGTDAISALNVARHYISNSPPAHAQEEALMTIVAALRTLRPGGTE